MFEAFGFRLLRINGSHHVFARPGIQEIVNAQPTKDGKAEEYQVRQLLRLVERYGFHTEEGAMRDYEINLFLNEADGLWVADIPDLPGCSAQGETLEEAAHEIQMAKAVWLEVAEEIGKPIPEPTYRPAIYVAGYTDGRREGAAPLT